MFIRTQWFVLQTGYDIGTDLPYGFSLGLGKASPYRWLIEWHFDLPRVVWADRYWRIDEPGMLKGWPIARAADRWTALMAMAGLRYWPKAMIWRRCFKVVVL